MSKNRNVYLSQYFLGYFDKNCDFTDARVRAALQRTDAELQRRLTNTEVSVKEINDLWDALNAFESTLKEYKSDFPTLYRVFKANNFTYKK